MADLDKALATQLANIEKRTGKTLAELTAIVKGSGLTKHGELVAMLKAELGMGHGDANTLVHTALKSDGQSAAQGLDRRYRRRRAALWSSSGAMRLPGRLELHQVCGPGALTQTDALTVPLVGGRCFRANLLMRPVLWRPQ